jgi:GT2 family glycosyltransferase
MDISIIIVSYNVREYIVSCIQSIYKHSKSNYSFEIIVVDNNSKDGTIDSLNKNFPNISLIKNSYNAGFSVGVNNGFKICKGKYILVLNPDTVFVEDTLDKLIDASNKQKEFGAIGPALISENGIMQQSIWRKPSLVNTLLSIFHLDFLNYKKNYRNYNFEDFSMVETISGAAFFFKRDIFVELNGLNEKLFWMEDIDFSMRLNKAGYKTYYFPLTKIIHFSGKSAKKNYKVAISNQLLSKVKFFRIHHSKMSANIILFSILAVSLIKSIIIFFIAPFSKIYRKKLNAYLFTIRSILNI